MLDISTVPESILYNSQVSAIEYSFSLGEHEHFFFGEGFGQLCAPAFFWPLLLGFAELGYKATMVFDDIRVDFWSFDLRDLSFDAWFNCLMAFG